ncbi:MAG: DUF3800 domain-containing protein [Anaerolineales bacterium]
MSTRHYYVDESGDGALFNRRGKVIVGAEGCSRFFILGVLDVRSPEDLSRRMEDLRGRLLADPYFQKVPSMQPEARKTAIAFHAKNDASEVRREVFSLLRKQELRFIAVVRDKRKVLEYVRQRNERETSYRYHPNELYDYMVRRLFKNLLHKDDVYHLCFSKRGKADRTAALRKALEAARNRFASQRGLTGESTIRVHPASPPGNACLQAADYFLWALQRLYERREDRYVEYLWPGFRMVHDIDDTRQHQYGVYYTQKKPLTLAALDEFLLGI